MAAIICMIATVGCREESHIFICGDIFYFMNLDESESGTYVMPPTEIDVTHNSMTELHVERNAFVANANPKQEVKIVVDETLSTAEMDVDFTIGADVLSFNGKDVTHLPLTVSVGDDTAGKKIVLQLVYEYYDISPLEGRTCDKLTINIE